MNMELGIGWEPGSGPRLGSRPGAGIQKRPVDDLAGAPVRLLGRAWILGLQGGERGICVQNRCGQNRLVRTALVRSTSNKGDSFGGECEKLTRGDARGSLANAMPG